MTAFTYQAASKPLRGRRHTIAIRLACHPNNIEAAAIMGMPGYRSIEPAKDGQAIVRFERFGRDAAELCRRLTAELRMVTTVRILGA